MTVNWDPLKKLVQQEQRFLLTSHVRPDCDALGSELAMAGVLRACNKDVVIVNDHPTPPNLAFIDPKREITPLDTYVAGFPEPPDVVMVLDTSAWVQLGRMAEYIQRFEGKVAVVDHHVGEDDLDAVLLKDTSAEATGRLVIEAAQALGVPLTTDIASPAFAALATDTGWFRFASVRGDTYRLAGKMVDAGADPAAIYAQLYERDTVGRVRLRGVILSRVAVELEGKLVHTYVETADFERTGAVYSDTEDVVNMTLAIEGTEVAVIFVEQPTGEVKVSFRSRSLFNCSEMASRFGGGGHKAAAGAMVEGPLEAARERVLEAVREEMARLAGTR